MVSEGPYELLDLASGQRPHVTSAVRQGAPRADLLEYLTGDHAADSVGADGSGLWTEPGEKRCGWWTDRPFSTRTPPLGSRSCNDVRWVSSALNPVAQMMASIGSRELPTEWALLGSITVSMGRTTKSPRPWAARFSGWRAILCR